MRSRPLPDPGSTTQRVILAGDIGGTKINLALFKRVGPGRVGPPIDPESHKSTEFGSFEELSGATTNASTVGLGPSRRTVNVTEDANSHRNPGPKRNETDPLPSSRSSRS